MITSTSTHTLPNYRRVRICGSFQSGSFIWVLVTCQPRRLEILAVQNVKTYQILDSVTWVKHNGCVSAVCHNLLPLGVHASLENNKKHQSRLQLSLSHSAFNTQVTATSATRPPWPAFCRCRVWLFGAPRLKGCKYECTATSKLSVLFLSQHMGNGRGFVSVKWDFCYFCILLFCFFCLTRAHLVFWLHAESLTVPDWRQKDAVKEKDSLSQTE